MEYVAHKGCRACNVLPVDRNLTTPNRNKLIFIQSTFDETAHEEQYVAKKETLAFVPVHAFSFDHGRPLQWEHAPPPFLVSRCQAAQPCPSIHHAPNMCRKKEMQIAVACSRVVSSTKSKRAIVFFLLILLITLCANMYIKSDCVCTSFESFFSHFFFHVLQTKHSKIHIGRLAP